MWFRVQRLLDGCSACWQAVLTELLDVSNAFFVPIPTYPPTCACHSTHSTHPCPWQAPDEDVEALVLHAGPEGSLAPAHICRGEGSFRACLERLGEPLPEDASEGSEGGEGSENGDRQAGSAEPELQAATVS